MKFTMKFTPPPSLMTHAQVCKDLASGALTLADGDSITLNDYVCNFVGDEHKLIAMSLKRVASGGGAPAAGAAGGSACHRCCWCW